MTNQRRTRFIDLLTAHSSEDSPTWRESRESRRERVMNAFWIPTATAPHAQVINLAPRRTRPL